MKPGAHKGPKDSGAGSPDPKDEGEKDTDPKDSGDQGDDGKAKDESDDKKEGDDLYTDPEKARKEIEKLRKESARHRTKNKELEASISAGSEREKKMKAALGIEDEAEQPEEKAKKLQSKNEELEIELTITRMARQHEIPVEQDKYFRFLLGEKFEALKDDEELSEEAIQEVVDEIKAVAGKKEKKPANTGLDSKGNPPPGGTGSVTAEQFVKMTTSEKNQLYLKSPSEYNNLLASAKEKKLI